MKGIVKSVMEHKGEKTQNGKKFCGKYVENKAYSEHWRKKWE